MNVLSGATLASGRSAVLLAFWCWQAAIWVLIPRYQRGTITYEKGRWRQKGGNLYLKIFAQEGLGRPDLEIGGEVEAVTRYLKKLLPEREFPQIQAALIFTT